MDYATREGEIPQRKGIIILLSADAGCSDLDSVRPCAGRLQRYGFDGAEYRSVCVHIYAPLQRVRYTVLRSRPETHYQPLFTLKASGGGEK